MESNSKEDVIIITEKKEITRLIKIGRREERRKRNTAISLTMDQDPGGLVVAQLTCAVMLWSWPLHSIHASGYENQ